MYHRFSAVFPQEKKRKKKKKDKEEGKRGAIGQ